MRVLENMSRPASVLPLEVLMEVFAHLPAMDRLAASSVCKGWMRAAMEVPIDGMRIKLPGLPSTWTSGDKEVYVGRFSSFEFSGIDLTKEFLNFLQQYDHNIRSLKFVGCRMASGVVHLCREKVLGGKLQELEFVDCFFDIFPALPELRNLTVESSTDGVTLSDPDVTRLCEAVGPKLTSLRLRLAQVLYDPENVTYDQLALTTTGLLDFIQNKSKSLTNASLYVKGNCAEKHFHRVFLIEDFKCYTKRVWFDEDCTFFYLDSASGESLAVCL